MSRIDFYHLQKQNLEDVLPKLVEKAYATGSKIKIKIGNEARVEFINSLLWTFDEEAFIPHGSKKDGFAKEQPIWLSSEDDNPNQAEMLFLVDGAKFNLSIENNYSRIFGKKFPLSDLKKIISNKTTAVNGIKKHNKKVPKIRDF